MSNEELISRLNDVADELEKNPAYAAQAASFLRATAKHAPAPAPSLEREAIEALQELTIDAEYALKKWLNNGSYSMSNSVSKARAVLARAGKT